MIRSMILLLALLAASASLTERAAAALICGPSECTDTIAFSGGTTASFFDLPLFDPALGTLDSASLFIDATTITGVSVGSFNPDDGQGTMLALAQITGGFWSFQFPWPLVTEGFTQNLPTLAIACFAAPNDGCTNSTSEVGGIIEEIVIGDLPSFVGLGDFSVLVVAADVGIACELSTSPSGAPPAFNPDRTCIADGGASVFGGLTVEYRYTAAVTALPSPASLALFGPGLVVAAGLGFLRRRRADLP